MDTAADITAVPLRLLTGWGLEPESEVLVSGYDGVTGTVQTYTVAFELPHARIRRIEVIPIADDYVLIGRDILNNFYIDLDGPELTFEMRIARDSGKQQPANS